MPLTYEPGGLVGGGAGGGGGVGWPWGANPGFVPWPPPPAPGANPWAQGTTAYRDLVTQETLGIPVTCPPGENVYGYDDCGRPFFLPTRLTLCPGDAWTPPDGGYYDPLPQPVTPQPWPAGTPGVHGGPGTVSPYGPAGAGAGIVLPGAPPAAAGAEEAPAAAGGGWWLALAAAGAAGMIGLGIVAGRRRRRRKGRR